LKDKTSEPYEVSLGFEDQITRPVLALELSPDGITLYEMSYDGNWRALSRADVSDPFLPKKMSAMRAAARASQGRFFKSQLWIPTEQIKVLDLPIEATDPEDQRQAVLNQLQHLPDIDASNVTFAVGEGKSKGFAPVAVIDNNVLKEARRFAAGYGFGTDDITAANALPEFRRQPYFNAPSATVHKLAPDLRKVVFGAGMALLVGVIAAGGYFLYSKLDFSGDPGQEISITETRALDPAEDPRAPIRPTELSTIEGAITPNVIVDGQGLGPIPAIDSNSSAFDTQISQLSPNSDTAIDSAPDALVIHASPASSNAPPKHPFQSQPDNLPAPESMGFPLLASRAPSGDIGIVASDFTGARISAKPVTKTPQILEVAQRPNEISLDEQSTVSLSGQYTKFSDSLGLSQVVSNNAAALRLARVMEAQNLPPIIVAGRPTILPVLRAGLPVPDRQIATIAEVPPAVTAPVPNTDIVVDIAPVPLDIAALQNVPPVVLTQRPDWVVFLRGGAEIPAAVPVPSPVSSTLAEGATLDLVPAPAADVLSAAQQEAAALRPIARPDSIAITALLNDPSLSAGAVTSTTQPLHRAADFAAKSNALAEKLAEVTRTTPRFTDTPRDVQLPTNANVAAEATIVGGINLNEMSLVGVYGKPGEYRALIRLRGGKYKMVERGDVIDRWNVVAISESSVRLQKGSQTNTLRMPG